MSKINYFNKKNLPNFFYLNTTLTSKKHELAHFFFKFVFTNVSLSQNSDKSSVADTLLKKRSIN